MEWNEHCDRFRFVRPDGWRDLSGEELRRLGHEERCRVWAGVAGEFDDRPALVHVTMVPGDLDEYVTWLESDTRGRAELVTRVGGPSLSVVGGVDAAVLEYSCLDYREVDPDDADPLPRHMCLMLVVAGVAGYLHRISLYAMDEDIAQRGAEFQQMLDSWLWADLVLADGQVDSGV